MIRMAKCTAGRTSRKSTAFAAPLHRLDTGSTVQTVAFASEKHEHPFVFTRSARRITRF